MATETQELPEIGEIVIATIKKTGDHGAYVSLDEYDIFKVSYIYQKLRRDGLER